MSGHVTLAKNVPKSNILSLRACGIRIFSGPCWIVCNDKNETSRIMEVVPLQ
jgi:hypothetical protein